MAIALWLPRSLVLLATASIVTLAVPSAAEDRAADKTVAREPAAQHEFLIGPADVLEVAVWNNTLISRTVPVRPDGKISLPVLNDVKAAGLTPTELQTTLAKALAGYIQAPEVSVIVREIHSLKVSVIGEVKTAGRYELTGHATVLDVLAMAGGLAEYADRNRIVILRREGNATTQIPFAYDKLTPANGSKGQDNFFVQADDIILVR